MYSLGIRIAEVLKKSDIEPAEMPISAIVYHSLVFRQAQ